MSTRQSICALPGRPVYLCWMPWLSQCTVHHQQLRRVFRHLCWCVWEADWWMQWWVTDSETTHVKCSNFHTAYKLEDYDVFLQILSVPYARKAARCFVTHCQRSGKSTRLQPTLRQTGPVNLGEKIDENSTEYQDFVRYFYFECWERHASCMSISKLRPLTPSYTFLVYLWYPYFTWYAVWLVWNKNTGLVIIGGMHPEAVGGGGDWW